MPPRSQDPRSSPGEAGSGRQLILTGATAVLNPVTSNRHECLKILPRV